MPELGKLFSCADDGTVREWRITEGTAAVRSAVSESNVRLTKLRALMRDPMYKAVSVCQAHIRRNLVMKNMTRFKYLLVGARYRYQGICSLISFDQNFLGIISQLLAGFMSPLLNHFLAAHIAQKSNPSKKESEIPFDMDKLKRVTEALQALLLYHSSVMEKLEMHKEDFPFCIETGAILEGDDTVSRLYILLLNNLDVFTEIMISLDTKPGFYEAAENEMMTRLDYASFRVFLFALSKYWVQVQVPMNEILMHTTVTSDADYLCHAIVRSSCFEAVLGKVVRAALGKARIHGSLAKALQPSEIALMDKFVHEDPGTFLTEETCTLKQRLKKDRPLRLLVTETHLFIHTDTGNMKKEKLMEVIPLKAISSIQQQGDVREIAITNDDLSKYNSMTVTHSKKKGDSSSITSRVLSFADNARADQFLKEVDATISTARHGITSQPLSAQIAEAAKCRSRSPKPELAACKDWKLPDFPVILVQYLSRSDNESFTNMLGLPVSESKVNGLFQAFNGTSDVDKRMRAVADVLPYAGLQNVFAALLDYFRRLSSPVLDTESLNGCLNSASKEEYIDVAKKMPVEGAWLFGYVMKFLRCKVIVALNRSAYEDPVSVLASMCCVPLFWNLSVDLNNVISYMPRAFLACKNMLTWAEDIFADQEEVLALFSESELESDVEELKRIAKANFAKEEAQRQQAALTREIKKLEKAKAAIKEEVARNRGKAVLDRMISDQRTEFEARVMEEESKVKEGSEAFEMLKRQQAQAKAKAEAKMRMLKDKQQNSSGTLNSKSMSDQSLQNLLGTLGKTSSSGSLQASKSSIAAVSGNKSLDELKVPTINIPVLQPTKKQLRLCIVIPELPTSN